MPRYRIEPVDALAGQNVHVPPEILCQGRRVAAAQPFRQSIVAKTRLDGGGIVENVDAFIQCHPEPALVIDMKVMDVIGPKAIRHREDVKASAAILRQTSA